MNAVKSLRLMMLVVGITAFAPILAPFEGSIRYDISTTGSVPPEVARMIGKFYELKFKGNDIRIVSTAPLKSEILLKKELQKMFIIRADQKNIYELDLNDPRIPAPSSRPVVARTNESAKIAGYLCTRFTVKHRDGVEIDVWSTSDLSVNALNTIRIFGGRISLPSEVSGTPLKIQIKTKDYSITGKATLVKAATMVAKDFEVPEGMITHKL